MSSRLRHSQLCDSRLIKAAAAALFAASWLFSGCATLNGSIAPTRDAWLGASYDEVVTRWGTPARSTSFNDGRLVYTWVSEGVASRSAMRPSIGVSAGSGMGVGIGFGFGMGASHDTPVTCERNLIFRDGRVVDQSWFGPAEFCATFRRDSR